MRNERDAVGEIERGETERDGKRKMNSRRERFCDLFVQMNECCHRILFFMCEFKSSSARTSKAATCASGSSVLYCKFTDVGLGRIST